uniref:Uncharacterized protein n=1 Tax=Arundo donax TaxID=35708 RepID=A0A0A9G501_ARUDO
MIKVLLLNYHQVNLSYAWVDFSIHHYLTAHQFILDISSLDEQITCRWFVMLPLS